MLSLKTKLLTLISLSTVTLSQIPVQTFSPLGIAPAFAQSTYAQNAEVEKLLKQGDDQSDAGKPDAALQSYQKVLEIAKSKGDRLGEGNSLNRLGNLYLYDLHDSAKAKAYYQQALELSQAIPDLVLEAKTTINLGNIYKVAGQYSQAVPYHQKGVEIARNAKDCQVEALAYQNLNYDYFLQNLPKSTLYVEKALDTLRACPSRSAEDTPKNLKRQADLEINLGRNYYLQHVFGATIPLGGSPNPPPSNNVPKTGQFLEKAIQAYQRGADIAQKTGDRTQQATALNGVVDIYKNQGRYSEAQGVLEKAAQTLRQTPNAKYALAKTLVSLVEIYGYSRSWDKAIRVGSEALVILRKPPSSVQDSLEYQNYEAQALLGMGDANRNQQQYPEAIKNYQEVINVAQGVLTQTQKPSSSSNQNWMLVQQTNAKLKLVAACAQIKGVYAVSGQPDKSPEVCNSR
jgi:tetratricopeptide (TPR) repeat protein